MLRLKRVLAVFQLLQVHILVAIFALVLMGTSIWALGKLMTVEEHINIVNARGAASSSLQSLTQQSLTSRKRLLLEGKAEIPAEETDNLSQLVDDYRTETIAGSTIPGFIAALLPDSIIPMSSEESVAIDAYVAARAAWDQCYDRVKESVEADQLNQAQAILYNECDTQYKTLIVTGSQLLFAKDLSWTHTYAATATHMTIVVLLSTILLSLTPLLGILLSVTSSRMVKPFLLLTNAASAIAGRRYRDETIREIESRSDALGMLAHHLAEAAHQIQSREAALQQELNTLTEQVKEYKRNRIVAVSGRQMVEDR